MGVIFRYTMRRLRGQILGWGGGLALLGVMMVSIFDSFAGQMDELAGVLERSFDVFHLFAFFYDLQHAVVAGVNAEGEILKTDLTHSDEYIPVCTVGAYAIGAAQCEPLELSPLDFVTYGVHAFLDKVEVIIFEVELPVALAVPVLYLVHDIFGATRPVLR